MASSVARNGGDKGKAPASMAPSSSRGVKDRGIRIFDTPPESPWRLSAVAGGEGEEDALPSPVARARRCDVYVGHGGAAEEVGRLVSWLRAELEMLGVPCADADRQRRCRDAPAHAAARAAMDAAVVGVVVITPKSMANPYAVEEVRAFLERGILLPVLVGLGREDCVPEEIIQSKGYLWGKFGGRLWMLYDGAESEWREAVDGLSRTDPAVVVDAGNLRSCLFDVLEILGARLGRRMITEAVKNWRTAVDLELPFPRNAGFIGRERELCDLETMLLGDVRAVDGADGKKSMHLVEAASEGPFLNGVVCISGDPGRGKTELVLEFAHRHAQEYKKLLWVHGEARHLRQSYLKLADHLGLAVGDDISPPAKRSSCNSRSLRDIEGDAIAKIRKELMRDIPYLVVIDNLESEKDWWDGRAVQDLLPRAGGRSTHVIVTTRLSRLRGIRTFAMPNLAAAETMLLMKGGRIRTFDPEDAIVLRGIEDKLGGVPLGLALVGAILSEIDAGPAELRDAMRKAPHRAATWASKDEPALRDNPGLVQLLDACIAMLGTEAAKLIEASSFFAPAPIPVAMLVRAAYGGAGEPRLWKRMMRTLHLSCASPRAPSSSDRRAEPEAFAALLRLGIARKCTQPGCVSVHAVFRLFGRKAGSGQLVARSAVRAIAAAEGGAEEHAHHVWAACLSLFRFQAPAAAVELPPLELARFAARSVLPLAAHAVAAYSSYRAALDLLLEATDAVHAAEGLYAAPPRPGVELDPAAYQELARARAETLKVRALMMMRGGQYAIAENLCLTAIGILEVVCGDAHPETQAVRAILEHAVASMVDMSS